MFQNMIDVAEGQWGKTPPMKIAEKDINCSSEKDEVKQKCRNKFLVCVFLHGANRKHHNKCIEELNNVHLRGSNNHPKTVKEAMTHFSHHMDKANRQKSRMVSFMQMGVECHCCCEHGHITTNCPKLARKKELKVNAN